MKDAHVIQNIEYDTGQQMNTIINLLESIHIELMTMNRNLEKLNIQQKNLQQQCETVHYKDIPPNLLNLPTYQSNILNRRS
jgi:hypothetical protein